LLWGTPTLEKPGFPGILIPDTVMTIHLKALEEYFLIIQFDSIILGREKSIL
jgi:hypothetical protein